VCSIFFLVQLEILCLISRLNKGKCTLNIKISHWCLLLRLRKLHFKTRLEHNIKCSIFHRDKKRRRTWPSTCTELQIPTHPILKLSSIHLCFLLILPPPPLLLPLQLFVLKTGEGDNQTKVLKLNYSSSMHGERTDFVGGRIYRHGQLHMMCLLEIFISAIWLKFYS
jgi:hypothetical protein